MGKADLAVFAFGERVTIGADYGLSATLDTAAAGTGLRRPEKYRGNMARTTYALTRVFSGS